jgi:hypothetical protein
MGETVAVVIAAMITALASDGCSSWLGALLLILCLIPAVGLFHAPS